MIVFVLGFGCTPDDDQVVVQDTAFFDLGQFFDQEVQDWTGKRVNKIVELNEAQEVQSFKDLNYEAEFQLFKQADINKTALLDKYEVDSTYESGVLKQVQYKAKNEKLNTQELTIQYAGDEVFALTISRSVQNVLFQTEQQLNYEAGKAYSIKTVQSVRFFAPKSTSISVQLQ